MAGSGGQRKRGRRSKGRRQAQLIRTLDHELRRTILRMLDESEEPTSPVRIARLMHKPLSSISYHVKVLSQLGAVAEVDQGQVRGALEHFYLPTIEGNGPILSLLDETREADEAAGPDNR